MTAMELLAAIAIVGLLLAVLLPAVQQVRESARQSSCRNHLHQFGVALSAFADTHGGFPTSLLPESPHRRLLPYFEQRALLHAIQQIAAPSAGPSAIDWYVESYACPDDPVAQELMQQVGTTNYFYNRGTRFASAGMLNGFVKSVRVDTRPADVTDGLSQTMAMCERLNVSVLPPAVPPGLNEPRRVRWWTEQRYRNPGEEGLAVEECRTRRTSIVPQVGAVWALNLEGVSVYDHLLPPNESGCYNGPEDFGIDSAAFLSPASSNHPGGVTALVADGAVRFINESIDLGVWGALGTRNGREPGARSF